MIKRMNTYIKSGLSMNVVVQLWSNVEPRLRIQISFGWFDVVYFLSGIEYFYMPQLTIDCEHCLPSSLIYEFFISRTNQNREKQKKPKIIYIFIAFETRAMKSLVCRLPDQLLIDFFLLLLVRGAFSPFYVQSVEYYPVS